MVQWVVASRHERPIGAPAWVEWTTLEATTAPPLRAAGLALARGERVVFSEDSCRWGPEWPRAWGHWEGLVGQGGVRDESGPEPWNVAVFLLEYGPALGPGSGRPRLLPGNNFGAVRDLARRALGPDGLREGDLLALAHREGLRVDFLGEAGLAHARGQGARRAISDRLRFGWDHGCVRPGPWPLSLVAGPLVLLAQLLRQVRIVARWPRSIGPDAVLWTIALAGAFSLGEWLGWSTRGVRRRFGTSARLVAPALVPASSRPPGRGNERALA